MSLPDRSIDQDTCLLRQRASLGIALEEAAIETLSDALRALREADHQDVAYSEYRIRVHRIGILKHRAIMTAAGIDV